MNSVNAVRHNINLVTAGVKHCFVAHVLIRAAAAAWGLLAWETDLVACMKTVAVAVGT